MIAPIQVSQGDRTVFVSAPAIQVDSALAGTVAGLSPRARLILDSASPPPDSLDGVTVSLVVPDDAVLPGQQVDLLAVAWFPRDLRLRLRREPVITLRTPDGVWAYPQAAPREVAGARLVRGRWVDQFVTHQVVFPLQPGRISVPRAVVDFALPVAYSYFSREDQYALRSDSALITVVAPPEARRPHDDRGVVARDLTVDVAVSAADTRVGEPLDVTTTLAGTGNVSLWPEPVLRWPTGFRAYAAQTVVVLEPREGRMAGSKTFQYLVVPDSAGAFVLADVRYPYYDLAARDYRVARSAPRPVAVALGAEPRPARALPPLVSPGGPSWSDRLAGRMFPWVWAALLFGPPLAVLARHRRSASARRQTVERRRREAGEGLSALERDFQTILASHVPDPALRDGAGLAQALRAAGVGRGVAEHVMRLRDRLRAARFAPRGGGDVADLGAELRQVLRVLDGEPAGVRPRRVAPIALLLLAAGRPLAGQVASAEALYEAGALRAAADSFAARAEREPWEAAHWYNLGATLYRAGADGKATAAWTRAARLEPRSPVIRRARRLLPVPDAASGPLLAVGVATPGEWALIAGACWIGCWLVLARRRMPVAALLGALVLGAALPAWIEWRRRVRPVAVVLQSGTPVRGAPYGGASADVALEAGAAVVLARRHGAWVEVRRADGVHGWVLQGEVALL